MIRLFSLLLLVIFAGCCSIPPVVPEKVQANTQPVIEINEPAIRYDKRPESPAGFYEYCEKYSTKIECGGKK
jgi:hypothetical protein